MKLKYIPFWALLLFSAAAVSYANPAVEPDRSALDALLREAYTHSPALNVAYARWQSALEAVPQAEALPDPTLAYGRFLQRMQTRQQFRIEQMFPGFGKRALRGEVAEANAAIAAKTLEAAAADVRMQVLQAVARYQLAVRSVDLIEANLTLLEKLDAVAGRRYRTGDASQADVLRLESEAETLRVELQSWQARQAPLRARVNAIVGRGQDSPLPPDLELTPAETPEAVGVDARALLANNPDLSVALTRIEAAERAQSLARRVSRPDFSFGIEYMDNRGDASDEVMAMVSVSLPIWQSRYRALRLQASADTRAAEADYDSHFNRIEADARMVLFEVQDAQRNANLLTEALLPRARQTLSVIEADYRTGRAGFLDLLEAQRALLELELGQLRAETEVFLRAAEWERLTRGRIALPTHDTQD